MITGNTAPPTIAMMTHEAPCFVLGPRPLMLSEKIVGNMTDIKNSTPTNAYIDKVPFRKMASSNSTTLAALYSASKRGAVMKLKKYVPTNRPIINASNAADKISAADFSPMPAT